MAELEDAPQPPQEGTKPEVKAEDLALWKDTIHKEARSLLERFLPEALPQEPTVMLPDTQTENHSAGGQYIGKFDGKHYVRMSNTAIEVGKSAILSAEFFAESQRELEEFLRDLSEITGAPQESLEQQHTTKEKAPLFSQEDLDWREGLKSGQDDYSTSIWSDIETAVHEMVHQKQAELNPQAFNQLDFDPTGLDSDTLDTKLKQLNPENDSLNEGLDYTIQEGGATVASYYVMAQLENELRGSNRISAAERVKKARKVGMRAAMHPAKNLVGGKETNWKMHYEGFLIPYTQHYVDGIKVVGKLKRALGTGGAIGFLQSVDLNACQGILRGSPEYQQFLQDPTTLPRIKTMT